MNIKDKFTPETHQTRSHMPWRILDLNTPEGCWIAVGLEYEMPIYLNDNGEALACNNSGQVVDSYDLIPIQHPPIDLPTNLRPKIKWAAMDASGYWWAFNKRPEKFENHYGCGYDIWVVHPVWEKKGVSLYAFDIPKDLAGWQSSLHELVDGMWVRVHS